MSLNLFLNISQGIIFYFNIFETSGSQPVVHKKAIMTEKLPKKSHQFGNLIKMIQFSIMY